MMKKSIIFAPMRKILLVFTLVGVVCLSACFRKSETNIQEDTTVQSVEQSEGRLTADDDASGSSTREGWTGSYDESGESHEGRHSVEIRHVGDDEAYSPSTATDLLAVASGRQGRILHRVGYTTSYNAEWLIPNWVAWRLTHDHTSGDFKRKGVPYQEDDDVSPRVTNDDYKASDYSRGHMCPSGDNKWDRRAQEQSFLLTNTCPQDRTLNGGDWNELEMRCRRWAEHYGEVYIVAGPIVRSRQPRTIGRNEVVVPDGFFKVVLRMEDGPRAIGFIYDNRQDHHRKMREYVVSVDEVEQTTGYDFFAALPDEVERTIEAHADLDDW